HCAYASATDDLARQQPTIAVTGPPKRGAVRHGRPLSRPQRGQFMRILFTTTMVAALAVALPACGQQPAADEAVETATESLSALSGTWTVDLASLKFGGKPDEFGVNGGNYDCASCIPPLSVAADGEFHPVADRPYYDSMAVKVVDDQTVEIRRKKGDREVSVITS